MNNKYFYNGLNSFGFTIILAGMVGGMIEIGWISIYSSLSSVSAINVARQISATILPYTADSYYAPMLGIFIHLVLSLILAIFFSAIILKPAIRRYGNLGIMLSSFMTLSIVWAINFIIVLPLLNPSFLSLMPYMVTLISKLLFGLAMGWVLVKSSPCTKLITE
jgi:hypothetical protein